ncbi:MAG: peptidylprolyl isomerase, partial [Oscillospiraceae bacterium]
MKAIKAKKVMVIVLASILAIVLIAGVFLSVLPAFMGDKQPIAGAQKGLYVNGNKITEPSIMTLDGEEVDFDTFRYYYLGMYNAALKQDPKFFDKEENVKQFKTAVEDSLKSGYLITKLLKDNNITASKEIEDYVDAGIAEAAKSYKTPAEFEAAIQSAYMTKDLFRNLQIEDALQPELMMAMVSDEASLKKDVLRAKHVLVQFDEAPAADSDEAKTFDEAAMKAEKLKKAQDIADRAKKGEDFDALIKEANDDPGMASNPDGYYFVEGNMVDEFYKGTKELEIDATSEPIETSYGYHVILRLEPDEKVLTKAKLID